MTEEKHNAFSHLVDMHIGDWDMDEWELIQELSDAAGDFADMASDGDVSDDAGQQFIQDANDACEAHGIPREERAHFISAAVFWAGVKTSHENATSVRQSLEMMYSL